MSYHGESPAKKVARLGIWDEVESKIKNRLRTEPSLVLLSSEAGDVSTLLGKGISPALIVGVDHDAHAADASKWRFPQVKCLRGDVFDIAAKLSGGKPYFGAIHMDLCSHITNESLKLISKMVPFLKPGGILGCALYAGREQTKWKIIVDQAKSKPDYDPFKFRAKLIATELHERVGNLRPRNFYYYLNGADKPMIVYLSKKDTRYRNIVAELRDAKYTTVSTTELELGELGARLDRQGEKADLLLNVDARTVSAWKAHFTRGTYR